VEQLALMPARTNMEIPPAVRSLPVAAGGISVCVTVLEVAAFGRSLACIPAGGRTPESRKRLQ